MVILLLKVLGLVAINQLRLVVMLFLMVMLPLQSGEMILTQQPRLKRLILILTVKIKLEVYNKRLTI